MVAAGKKKRTAASAAVHCAALLVEYLNRHRFHTERLEYVVECGDLLCHEGVVARLTVGKLRKHAVLVLQLRRRHHRTREEHERLRILAQSPRTLDAVFVVMVVGRGERE